MERQLTHVALFTALIAALGIIPSFQVISGVPITAQSMGVMLCGTILGSKRGGMAVILFLVLVVVGLPLLSGGRGGLGVFLGPSVGFLLGFPLAAFVAGLVVERTKLPVVWAASIGAALGGIVFLYIFGIIGMSVVLEKSITEAAALALIYLPGDLIKVVLVGFVTRAVEQSRPSALLSRT